MNLLTNAYTHSGKFHADDVFSSALLRILYPEIKFHRVHQIPDEAYDSDSIIFDVGYGKFDHHQAGSPVRSDGFPYAAFGLLWRKFAMNIPDMTEAAAQRLDNGFVKEIDIADNTGEYHSLSAVISAYNPTWNSNTKSDDAFEEAIDVAYSILSHVIQREIAKEAAKSEVTAALEKMENSIVILEDFVPWEEVLTDSGAIYVIYPSLRFEGAYNVQGVPIEKGSKEVRRPFPIEWRNCSESEISKVSGISGLTFCHKSGFLITCKDFESAVQAAKYSLNH